MRPNGIRSQHIDTDLTGILIPIWFEENGKPAPIVVAPFMGWDDAIDATNPAGAASTMGSVDGSESVLWPK